MTARRLALAALLALPLALAGCAADETCPTDAAFVQSGRAPTCSGPPQTVTITLPLCEDCSRTSPTCQADLTGVDTGDIFLNTVWNVCPEDQGCNLGSSCTTVTCTFSVPAGSYTVTVLTGPSTTPNFGLTVGGTSTCTGST